MFVQTRTDYSNAPFILQGFAFQKDSETIRQDATRTEDILFGTVMSYDPSTGFWTPFVDELATDGTEKPTGIILDRIAAADIAAGNVTDVPIMVGGETAIDGEQLVIENEKTLATVIGTLNVTVEQCLRWIGIFVEATTSINRGENQ